VDLDVALEDEGRGLPPEVALAGFRVLQEALTNVSRHARARSVSISILCDDGDLVLSTYDDGRGFDPRAAAGDRGSGLQGMRERAALVNGTLEIRSVPSEGTRVLFRAPAAAARSATDPEA
jgi:signal transduction histidine kinase